MQVQNARIAKLNVENLNQIETKTKVMAQETIKITQTKGEFLELLKGLWSASHLKGKELSVLINDNATLIRNLLDTLLWVNLAMNLQL